MAKRPEDPILMGISLADRLWMRVDRDGPTMPHMDTCCWIWTGSVSNPAKGYGALSSGKQKGTIGRAKAISAHRAAWVVTFGPVPDGLQVLHRCDNPPCCNPAHLWLGTNMDNVLDKVAKGRDQNQRKTHCMRGHPFDEENTIPNSKPGTRKCRTCSNVAQKLRARVRLAKQKEAKKNARP